MASVAESNPIPTKRGSPPLNSGDRLAQREFHARYEACPEHLKYELIGGVVYMASPLRLPHGEYHADLATVLTLYKAATPGVQVADNATTILADDSEPQPDLILRILPEFGGRSQTTPDDYVAGPPELIVEVAHSSVAIDLYDKKDDYTKAGVLEYIVVCLEEREIAWFDLTAGRKEKIDEDGILRSKRFPGLWINAGALFARNAAQLITTAQAGMATGEYAAFVKDLRARETASK